MAKKLEKDTEVVITEQQRLTDLIHNDGWVIAKKKLINKIRDNNSLNRIRIAPGATNEDIARELLARGLASTMVLEWLVEIEGNAAQLVDNNQLLADAENEAIFQFFPERSS